MRLYAQFDGLGVHAQFNKQGFSVLGFPSDNFGNQEFVNEDESLVLSSHLHVKFPMFAHTNAAERNADPIFKALGSAAGRYELELPQVFDWARWAINCRLPQPVTPQDLILAIQDALAN